MQFSDLTYCLCEGWKWKTIKKILEVYMEEKMSPTANKRMIKKNIERSSITSSKIHCNPVIIQKATVISGLVFLCEEVSVAVKLPLFPVPSVLPFLGGGQII